MGAVSRPTRVSIAGSTGSIGTQALDVVRADPDRFQVVALSAARSVALLAQQARLVRPERVLLADEGKAAELKSLLPPGTELLVGSSATGALADGVDIVLNGVVGFAGLPVTMAALAAGRRLALANKESLVAAGPIVEQALAAGGSIVPIDSEHCALHQCLGRDLPSPRGTSVARLLLTASGGPFRGRTRQELGEVTPAEALEHPTWAMGPMNTINSSTLMNKGLEVIEAHLLFSVPYDRIDVVVHPQSVVHSMVEFSDGATIAQMSMPDMRLPIGYALSYPERMPVSFGAINWSVLGRLDFAPPDMDAFPCLSLAYEAGRAGGTAPTCLNAANEVAVSAFLNGRLRWVDIPAVIEKALTSFVATDPRDIADVLAADGEARALAASYV